MITGLVNARFELVVALQVLSSDGAVHAIEAMIDTGFEGAISLPSWEVANLALLWKGEDRIILADGSTVPSDVYNATIIWDGQVWEIDVDAADVPPLIGMALLRGYDVHFQAVEGGSLTLQALSGGVS